jgi:hypothetical protein
MPPPGRFFARQCPDTQADIHPTTSSHVNFRKACANQDKASNEGGTKYHVHSQAIRCHCDWKMFVLTPSMLSEKQFLARAVNQTVDLFALFCSNRPKRDTNQLWLLRK